MKKLEEKILEYKKAYYQGKALVSDEEYDRLEEELRNKNPNSYVLNLVG